MNITVVGAGYVGLVTGTMMSYLGHHVICLDTDTQKIAQLNKNILPIYEPKLVEYFSPLVKEGKLKFLDNYNHQLQNSKAVFITVGTPSLSSGEANLQYIFTAIDNICNWIKEYCLIIIKSTVPPTTCNQIITYLTGKNLNFSIASNPEFLREGNAVEDFLNPDRILIGTNNKLAENTLTEIYLPLITRNIKMVRTDLVTAELTKYASNTFLATKIAFTNEMANLCEQTGANIKELTAAMGLDKRIGKEFLNPGPGFGGSCFPKDLLALSQIAKIFQVNCKIIDAVIKSNNQRTYDMVKKIYYIMENNGIFSRKAQNAEQIDDLPIIGYLRPTKEKLSKEINFRNKAISVLGLTYKAGTDDIRSSPAIKIIKLLLKKGANIKAFDPMGMIHAKKYLEELVDKTIFYANSALNACQNTDIIVIATEWSEFKDLDWETIRYQTNFPIIIDLHNILEKQKLLTLGFKYYGLGHN